MGIRAAMVFGIVMRIGAAQQGFVDRAVEWISPAEDTPLTAGQRWHDYWMQTAGPGAVLSEAVSAGFGQWKNSPPEWGQGGNGYGKRFSNNLAYNAVRNTLEHGTAALVHEDIRYFASGKQTVARRFVYALASPVTARRRSGARSISISGITGIVGVSLISRAWSPPSWQGGGNVAVSAALTYAGTAGVNLAREFVPGIVRHFRK
ncbi:MAG TPA: hypothetical protein VGF49_10570 [Candidatus Solibacter sp.]|jgi:hypothetical protein